jgi:hypothetical protein
LLFSFLAILTGPAVAATTYDFVATGKPGFAAGNFSLQYVDADGDARFSLNELVPGSFSGVWCQPGTQYAWFDTVVSLVPSHAYSPYTDGSGGTIWEFDVSPWNGSYEWQVNAASWTYTQSPVSTVPIPPSAFLLGAGLLGLAGRRRLKKS